MSRTRVSHHWYASLPVARVPLSALHGGKTRHLLVSVQFSDVYPRPRLLVYDAVRGWCRPVIRVPVSERRAPVRPRHLGVEIGSLDVGRRVVTSTGRAGAIVRVDQAPSSRGTETVVFLRMDDRLPSQPGLEFATPETLSWESDQ